MGKWLGKSILHLFFLKEVVQVILKGLGFSQWDWIRILKLFLAQGIGKQRMFIDPKSFY